MKQKGLRKLVSMILAVVMVLAMSITGFAATQTAGTGDGTITITNAVAGETYSAYKMLNLSYNTTTGSYSYTVASGWEGFFEDSNNGFTVDSQGYVTSTMTSDSSEVATVAKAALAYAAENNINPTASVTADVEGAVITSLELGYYLVDTSLGTLCSIGSTATNATINEKNSDVPGESKTVANSEGGTYGESNTAGIGDTVYYKVELTGLANKSGVSLVDTLSKGLTLDGNSTDGYVTVTVEGNNVSASTTVDGTETVNYSVSTTSNSDGSTTLTVTFEDSYLSTLASNAVIAVKYSAKVNEYAVIGTEGNENSAVLNYGTNHTVTDTTKTYVYGINIYKYTNSEDDGEVALSGAVFTLTKGEGDDLKYAKVSNGTLENWNEGITYLTASDVNGLVNINGLDAGEYTLTETTAPDGYNKLTESIIITISGNGTVTYETEGSGETLNSGNVNITIDDEQETVTNVVKVLNNAGSSLPSTGGMGTTIFYIVGGVLVLGAAVLFVTKKRLGNEN